MKPIKSILILVLLVSISFLSQGQDKYSTVKIYTPADKSERSRIIGLLQIDHFQETDDGAIVSEISATKLARLKTMKTRYEILVDDVAKNLETLNRQYYLDKSTGNQSSENRLAFEETGKTIGSIIPTPSAFVVQPTFGGYYSFAQMETAMNNLAIDYPALVQKISLGLSTENRDIWCIKISDNVNTDETNEPEVLFIGVQHAREAIGGSSMIFLMQYLCENYATDPRIKDLVDNREIFIVPCMN
ncbi:MAG: M14 family zinc carboxypeptidase, partial [Chitinophagaceae bacterium]